ncbi:unnamed protein product, partial [Closterium sp. Naga37s-1]
RSQPPRRQWDPVASTRCCTRRSPTWGCRAAHRPAARPLGWRTNQPAALASC